jgi:tRNA threonylcarbamoyl adenosine modification protein YeaZ
MQSSKILLINPGYDYIFVGLFEHHRRIATSSVHKHQASKTLITTIDTLLQNNNYSLHDLDFIAVNVGPGPFTTLRVAIATINGLAYGADIPLIAIDGFDIILHEEKKSCTTPSLGIMLNAFSDDVYFTLYTIHTHEKTTGYTNIKTWCEHLNTIIANTKTRPCLTLFGNGTMLYKEQLTALDAATVIIKTDAFNDGAMLDAMAQLTFTLWQQGDTKKMLLPLYMKATSALIKK